MSNPANHEHQRLLLLRAVRHAHISSSELWLHYFAIGGDAGEYEVEAYLHGSFTLPPLQRDLLAHAANELIDDRPPPPRAPYSTDETPSGSNGQRNGSGTTGDAPVEGGEAGAASGGDSSESTGGGGRGSDAGAAPGRRGGSFAGRSGDSQEEDTGWARDEGNLTDGSDTP